MEPRLQANPSRLIRHLVAGMILAVAVLTGACQGQKKAPAPAPPVVTVMDIVPEGCAC